MAVPQGRHPKKASELAGEYRAASAAWEDHFRRTGTWDTGLEQRMTKAHRAYLRAHDRLVDDEPEGGE